MPRVLGIDYGERRFGMAASDELGMIASPLPTLTRRRGKRPPFRQIREVIEQTGAAEIVVGLPLTSAGEDDDWTREVRAFADELQRRTGLPLHLVDERMTSARAERAVRSLGLRRSEREDKGRIDAAAAVLILQAYLDRDGSSEP